VHKSGSDKLKIVYRKPYISYAAKISTKFQRFTDFVEGGKFTMGFKRILHGASGSEKSKYDKTQLHGNVN